MDRFRISSLSCQNVNTNQYRLAHLGFSVPRQVYSSHVMAQCCQCGDCWNLTRKQSDRHVHCPPNDRPELPVWRLEPDKVTNQIGKHPPCDDPVLEVWRVLEPSLINCCTHRTIRSVNTEQPPRRGQELPRWRLLEPGMIYF